VLALRFSTRADWPSGVESFEVDNLTLEDVSGDEEIWLRELVDVEEPEFERPVDVRVWSRLRVHRRYLSPWAEINLCHEKVRGRRALIKVPSR
jgi:hypothetical protein